MTKGPYTIALVDDHAMFRSGIARLLAEFNDVHVVFEASNGIELQEEIKKHPLPDVILMDINMPKSDGYQATAWLRKNYPKIHVLVLSMFDEEESVIRMLKAGASGYVLKESRPVELHEAIKTVLVKGYYINDMVSGRLISSLQREEKPVMPQLVTAKEREFLELCCSELTYKEIAGKMSVSPRTIDNYREALFVKLQQKSRIGLVVYAIRNGLISLKSHT